MQLSNFFSFFLQQNHTNKCHLCVCVYLQLANDHKYTVMLAETMCNVLAYDLCRLEKIKYNEVLSLEAATREIISYEIKLSHRYELLAKILRRSEMLARECHLTAFSLNPAWRNYMTLVNFHKQYESSKRYQSLDGFNSILGAPTIEHNEYDPKANPVQSMLEGDKLATQLSKSDLWDDLASVITNPRIKTLRWSTNNWTELRQLCQHIHDEPDYKMCLIRQNVAAPDRNGLWYARQNNRELAKRLLHRTINKLAYRKSKWQRRKYVCCFEASSGLKGFVQM